MVVFLKKIDISGKAWCTVCETDINYASKGKTALLNHVKTKSHAKKVKHVTSHQNIKSLFSSDTSGIDKKEIVERADSCTPIHNIAKPAVPLFDRVSNAEAMILGTIAEHSMPLSFAPVITNLAKTLAEDKGALNGVQLSHTSASYKMKEGFGRTVQERVIVNMKRYPYSLNIDEATSNTNKKVLAVLVCYYNKITESVDVEHLCSFELYKVNSDTIYNLLSKFFMHNDIPFDNLVSIMLDSCGVMRGCKNGLEVKLRMKSPHILDIDGDSCHHMHNSSKIFCKEFEGWVEQLLSDLHEDHKWATDQESYLEQVCEMMGIAYSKPHRFLAHRWLSSYDGAMGLKRMLPAYQVLYFGLLNKENKVVYANVLEELFAKYNVNEKSQAIIKTFHAVLNKKCMTNAGKCRKSRIIDKIYFKLPTTQLQISVYTNVLPILKEYVMVFQRKQTLIHKLHDHQLEVFCTFLGCFLKAEYITDLKPAQLCSLDVTAKTHKLNVQQMFMGQQATSMVSNNPNSVTVKFIEQLSNAYEKCAAYMQKKLQLNITVLISYGSCRSWTFCNTETFECAH